jgi:hypothetical protein
LPIIAFCFWIGLYPTPFLKAMEVSVANVIQTVEKGSAGKPIQPKHAALQRDSGQRSAVSTTSEPRLGSRLSALGSSHEVSR